MFPFYFYSLFRFTVLHGFFDGLGWKIFRVSWLVFQTTGNSTPVSPKSNQKFMQ